MAYVELTDLKGDIPDEFLTQALDDDGDGEADAGNWDAVANKASEDVDAFLESRFPVPFATPYPAVVKRSARIFALEKLYLKRGVQPNPWTKQADAMRDKLEKIGNGDEPLSAAVSPSTPSGAVISSPSKTHSADGSLIV